MSDLIANPEGRFSRDEAQESINLPDGDMYMYMYVGGIKVNNGLLYLKGNIIRILMKQSME